MSDSLTPKDIDHIAKLANLIISSDQYGLFTSQLSSIIAFVSKLQEVPTKNINPTSQVTGLINIYREDVIDLSRLLSQDQALANAPVKHNGFFVVPAVFD